MKFIYSLLLFATINLGSIQAQVGVGTTTPKGALDIVSTDSGILIPRVALTALNVASPVTNPQMGALENSTLIYNTATAGVAPNNVVPGFYYWKGTTWVALAGSGSAPAPTNAWLLGGNAGTTADVDYFGTKDDVDIHFKTSGSNRFRITSGTSPSQILAYGGTEASPTYSWNGGTNTGMFLETQGSGNTINFSTGTILPGSGTSRFRIPNANQVHAMDRGTETLPFYTFSVDSDTGVFSPGGNQLGFSTNKKSRFEIPNAFQVHAVTRGTAALPFYSYKDDTNTGTFSPDIDQFAISTNGAEKVRVLADGQVGIGTTTPKTKLEVAGALSLNEGTALAMTNGTNDNVSLGTTPYSMYRITGPTAAFAISGVVPVTGANGQIVTIENTTSHDMTLKHQVTSTASNQILCPGAKDMVLKGQYATVTLQYNDTQKRWIVKSYAGETAASSQSVYSVKGTTDATLSNDQVWMDLPQMNITLTPKNSVIYVNFGASGDMETSSFPRSAGALFRLVNTTTNTAIAGVSSVVTDYDQDYWGNETVVTSWNVHLTMFPVSVTKGTSVSFKIQWLKDGIVTGALYNNVNSNVDAHHRNLTIVDQF